MQARRLRTLLIGTLALALPVMAGGQAQAGPITYDISIAIGGGSVTGTVVTNGSSGFLTAADLLSWSLNVDDTIDTVSYSSTDFGAFTELETGILWATSASLVLDYDATPTSSGSVFNLGLAEANSVWWPIFVNYVDPLDDFLGIAHFDPAGSFSHFSGVAPPLGKMTYATAQAVPVPEPGTLLLLGAGLAGLVARRRTNKSL